MDSPQMPKILVTGGTGLVGSAIKYIVDHEPTEFTKKYDWDFVGSAESDLRQKEASYRLLRRYKPTYVIHLAAKVGGLFANMRNRVDFLRDNIRINENIIDACDRSGVEKGIFCLSSCVFPVDPPSFPMDESMLHKGAVHESNEGYAYAKRLLHVQCKNHNLERKRKYMCVVPVNVYGPEDTFDLDKCHVIPALIKKCVESQKAGTDFIIEGDGTPLRQFIYSHDLAKAMIKILDRHETDYNKPIIICSDEEYSIKTIVDKIAGIVGFTGEIKYIGSDNGVFKKTVTNAYFKSLYPSVQFTSLQDGLTKTIRWYKNEVDVFAKKIIPKLSSVPSVTEKITLVLPTRGRPKLMDRMWSSVKKTAVVGDQIEVAFYIDDDDQPSIDKIKQLQEDDVRVKYMIGPRVSISEAWNNCYFKCATGSIIMLCGDDFIMRTKGWDAMVRAEFAKYIDRIVLVYGRDGYANESLATHPIIHKRWIETVGYFVPPYFHSDYVDTWLDDMAQRIGRRVYLPDMYNEHMHFIVGKAEKDTTTLERLIKHKDTNPAHIYKKRTDERVADAQKLQDVIDTLKYGDKLYQYKKKKALRKKMKQAEERAEQAERVADVQKRQAEEQKRQAEEQKRQAVEQKRQAVEYEKKLYHYTEKKALRKRMKQAEREAEHIHE
jgi:GDP-L-fucose synthase